MENLETLHNKGYSNKQISNILKIKEKSVTTLLNRKGLKSNKADLIELTQELKDLIIGSIFGDGSFKVDFERGTTRMQFCHSPKQKEYFLYKYSIIEKLGIAGKIKETRVFNTRYKEGFFDEIRFATLSNPIFRKFYESIYINRQRNVTLISKEDITEKVIAYWYFDDGHICSASYQITCESFNLEEVEYMTNILVSKFNILCTYDKNNNIYIKKESINDFNLILSNIDVPSLNYKIRGSV